MEKSELRKAFEAQHNAVTEAARNGTPGPEVLVTVTRLPTGALEVQTNTSHLWDKLAYIKQAYDDQFRLKNNPNVVITGFVIV